MAQHAPAASEPLPPRPRYDTPRTRRRREDRWFPIAVGLMLVAMALVAIYRPHLLRPRAQPNLLGVRQVLVDDQGGRLTVTFEQAPELRRVGGVVALRGGRREVFVVSTGPDQWTAFATFSRRGRPVHYDAPQACFVSRARSPMSFDRGTGLASVPGHEDALRTLAVRATPEAIEVAGL